MNETEMKNDIEEVFKRLRGIDAKASDEVIYLFRRVEERILKEIYLSNILKKYSSSELVAFLERVKTDDDNAIGISRGVLNMFIDNVNFYAPQCAKFYATKTQVA